MLLMLSADLKKLSPQELDEAAKLASDPPSAGAGGGGGGGGAEEAPPSLAGWCPVDVVYEAVVEEVVTRDKYHPLGIKVRARRDAVLRNNGC